MRGCAHVDNISVRSAVGLVCCWWSLSRPALWIYGLSVWSYIQAPLGVVAVHASGPAPAAPPNGALCPV